MIFPFPSMWISPTSSCCNTTPSQRPKGPILRPQLSGVTEPREKRAFSSETRRPNCGTPTWEEALCLGPVLLRRLLPRPNSNLRPELPNLPAGRSSYLFPDGLEETESSEGVPRIQKGPCMCVPNLDRGKPKRSLGKKVALMYCGVKLREGNEGKPPLVFPRASLAGSTRLVPRPDPSRGAFAGEEGRRRK